MKKYFTLFKVQLFHWFSYLWSKKKKFFVSVAILLIVGVGLKKTLDFKKQSETQREESKQSLSAPLRLEIEELPKQNLLVYSRCYGGDRNPDGCYIYTAELDKPISERRVYHALFPTVDENPHDSAFRLDLHGVVDKKVAFTQAYIHEKKLVSKLVLVDLLKGSEKVVNDQTGGGNISSVYVDTDRKRLYFRVDSVREESLHGQWFKYDVVNNVTEKLPIQMEYPSEASRILFADADKLYLADVPDGPTMWSWDWSKTFDLNSNTLIQVTPVHDAVFNRDGDRMVYQQTIDGIETIQVSKPDGSDKKEIYRAPKKSNYWGPYIYNITIDPIGQVVEAIIGNESGRENWENSDDHVWYRWLITEKRAAKYDYNPETSGGILLLPPPLESPLKGKITPVSWGAAQYMTKWVVFKKDDHLDSGKLYQLDKHTGDWFFTHSWSGYDDEYDLDLEKGEVILLEARDVLLVPEGLRE